MCGFIQVLLLEESKVNKLLSSINPQGMEFSKAQDHCFTQSLGIEFVQAAHGYSKWLELYQKKIISVFHIEYLLIFYNS